MILSIIIAGFLASIVAPFIHKIVPRFSGLVLCFVPLAFFGILANMIPDISAGETLQFSSQWFNAMNINLSFIVDGLSLTFALIISGVGSIILFYSGSYLHGHPKQARFYGYLLFFMTSMLGVVLSDNIISLFVFWELTSISSYLLIGFNHEKERSRYAALQALLVTGGGGLALMAGLIIMGTVGGSYTISELLTQSELFASHHLYLAMVILVFAGAFTKSAQFPFHFWLPNAMEAPTPVSAYLHSATMVKAGVFLLARFSPALGGTEVWHTTLIVIGGVTMLMGAAMAIGQNDLKRILAYTTVSALGIMVFLLGVGGKYAITAAVTFLVVHAMYKGALFLVAGAVDHETGTRDISKLGGLKKYLPIIAIAAALAAFSYCGIPPFLGFIAKELIYEATYSTSFYPILLTIIAVITNMFLVATAIMVAVVPFYGKFKETPKKPHEAPFPMWIGPVILGVLGVFTGLFPSIISNSLIQPSVVSVFSNSGAKLELWHGFNIILLLSVLTLAGGVLFFIMSRKVKKNISFFNKLGEFGPEKLYNICLNGLLKHAAWQTRFFQDGFLRHYFYYIIIVFSVLVAFVLFRYDILKDYHIVFTEFYFYEVLLIIIMILAAVKAIFSKTVLASVAALGIVGFGVAIIFALFSAPDLAFTQFSIETLTIILLVLVVYKAPRFLNKSPVKNKVSDAIVAIVSGVIITLLVLVVGSVAPDERISSYFLENSYVLAHGRNVVNVILVDFRMLDTMGEITVLAIAAIGIVALLKFSSKKNENDT